MLNYAAFMLSPIVIEFIFLLIHKRSVNLTPKLRKHYIVIMGVILFFMIGFMSEDVGSGDAHWYVQNWELLKQVHLKDLFTVISKIDIETGFEVWVWLSAHIFRWSQFFFIIYGALVSFTICRFLYLNVKDLCLGFVMFSTLGMFAFMVQGIRQGIAICFCILAIEMCKKRKLIPFLILVGAGTLFHGTAIIFLLVYLLPLLKLNFRGIIIFLVVAVVSIIFLDRIYSLVNTAINDSYAIGATKDTQGGYITLAIYLLILTAALIFPDDDKDFGFFFYLTAIGMITFALRYAASTITQRVAFYFMIAQPVLLSSVSFHFQKRQRIIMRSIIILLCLGIAMYKASYSDIVPYLFFWQG